MKTEQILITNIAQQEPDIVRAAEKIRAGELVVFPTETVYGLGADATNEAAVRSIYVAKGRPSDNPLIIHIATPEDAERYALTNKTYYKLAEKFMPGPLTVILPRRKGVCAAVTGGLDTVAVRCPSHPVARALIERAGVGIAAPSANLSVRPSPTTAAHARKDLDGRVSMILDGARLRWGLNPPSWHLTATSARFCAPAPLPTMPFAVFAARSRWHLLCLSALPKTSVRSPQA
ncbi:MAG: threonylcarbamoyl-AMP synthase [Clostridia bacterium]|nr:threonylcarbamoyl-AMP synthase [Clostridia bacterium]